MIRGYHNMLMRLRDIYRRIAKLRDKGRRKAGYSGELHAP